MMFRITSLQSLQSGKGPAGVILFRVIIAAVWFFCCGGALASMAPVSLQSLAENADLIIYGQVDGLATKQRLFEPGSLSEVENLAVYDIHVSFSPIEAIKGSVQRPVVIVTTVAGMEDHAVFRTGEQAILFLKRNEGEETYTTVALSQGKFDVGDGQVIREGMPVVEFLSLIREHLRPKPPAAPTIG